jgi:hypothetical protein
MWHEQGKAPAPAAAMALTLGLYEELDYTKPADPVAQPVKISSSS